MIVPQPSEGLEAKVSCDALQCIEDLEDRFPTGEQQEHILNLIREHLGEEDAATAGPATARSGAHHTDREEVEADEDTLAELDEMEGLVDEGTGQGAMEEVARDIDEQDA